MFFFNDAPPTEIYTLSLHDALPISSGSAAVRVLSSSLVVGQVAVALVLLTRSEEHTSELQSRPHLVCRLLLEKKKTREPLPARVLPRPAPAHRYRARSRAQPAADHP